MFIKTESETGIVEYLETSGGRVEIALKDDGTYRVHDPYESQDAETIDAARVIAEDMADYLNS